MKKIRTGRKAFHAKGARVSLKEGRREVAHAYLYIMRNDLHDEPFGLVEDVFVEETRRGMGHGTRLLKKLVKEARKEGCYKIVATSRRARKAVHRWYKKLGFKDYGVEFRLDL